MSYEDIYSLVPHYEIEPGWWKLKWKPLWRKTFSVYLSNYRYYGLGFRTYECGAHNGWGRSYDMVHVDIYFIRWAINIWVKWNYQVMAEGPSDITPMRPINIPTAKYLGESK